MLMHKLPHCLSAACFSFQKPFSTLYYKASDLLGRFVFVSKNIFLVLSLKEWQQFIVNLKETIFPLV